MRYRIGIFDPAFVLEGHFTAFDRYIAQLLDDDRIQAVFLDANGLMREAYKDGIASSRPPEFVRLSEAAPVRLPFGRRINNFFSRARAWRHRYAEIARLKLDLVLITSESYDPLFYAFRPRFRYGLFVLNPRLYVYPPESRGLARKMMSAFFSWKYRLLAKRAAFVMTTSEPPMIRDLEERLARPLPWLPNLPMEDAPVRWQEPLFDFLTIGTISWSKNHLFALSAFKERLLPYRYLVAGLPRDATGSEVVRTVQDMGKDARLSVEGRFGHIVADEYRSIIRSASFLLFPYDFARGNISSQVMYDSFQQEKPIIAPDIQPFAWYVQRYGIGLLYKEGDPDSLAAALEEALRKGPDAFSKGFADLKRDHSLVVISERFLKAVLPAIAAD